MPHDQPRLFLVSLEPPSTQQYPRIKLKAPLNPITIL
jgi:hypothetical protein